MGVQRERLSDKSPVPEEAQPPLASAQGDRHQHHQPSPTAAPTASQHGQQEPAPYGAGSWSVPTIPRPRPTRHRHVPAALYALLLMSFFLPFMTVSCNAGGMGSRRTYTGVDLLRDKPVEDLASMMRSSNPGSSGGGAGGGGTFTLKYQLILALAFGALGLVGALWRGRAGRVASIVAGCVALGGLLWFRALWDSTLAQFEGTENRYRFGFWAALVCAALASLASAFVYLRERNHEGPGLGREERAKDTG